MVPTANLWRTIQWATRKGTLTLSQTKVILSIYKRLSTLWIMVLENTPSVVSFTLISTMRANCSWTFESNIRGWSAVYENATGVVTVRPRYDWQSEPVVTGVKIRFSLEAIVQLFLSYAKSRSKDLVRCAIAVSRPSVHATKRVHGSPDKIYLSNSQKSGGQTHETLNQHHPLAQSGTIRECSSHLEHDKQSAFRTRRRLSASKGTVSSKLSIVKTLQEYSYPDVVPAMTHQPTCTIREPRTTLPGVQSIRKTRLAP